MLECLSKKHEVHDAIEVVDVASVQLLSSGGESPAASPSRWRSSEHNRHRYPVWFMCEVCVCVYPQHVPRDLTLSLWFCF